MASPASDAPAVVGRPRHLRRIARSFGYAADGLATMFRTQPNFWVHVIAAVLALILGVALHLSAAELALVVLTLAAVLVVECVNTALETICDLVQPAFHPLVKRAKDVSAAAVLIAAIASVGIAILLFGPHVAGMVK